MVTASTASGSTFSTRTGYTYVNNLVTGATQQGLYSIAVSGQYMDSTMAAGLVTTYGYRVTPKTDDMGSATTYIISWDY